MNIDFHLYGTYCAAILAGMDEESSRKIAFAAQMVDDFTEDITKDINVATSTNISNPTCEYVLKNIKAIIKNGFESDNTEEVNNIISMSKTWICFHFLPGTQSPDLTEAAISDKSVLRCGTGGKTSNSLVNENSVIYKDLISLGIGMHIIADTFAHSGFSGLITRNPILQNNMWVIEDGSRKDIPTFSERVPRAFVNVIPGAFYMGHAAAGHFPDISTAELEYEFGIDRRLAVLHKDNVGYFSSAFSVLVELIENYKEIKGLGEKHEGEGYYEHCYNRLKTYLTNVKAENRSINYADRYTVETDKAFENLLNGLGNIMEVQVPNNILNSQELTNGYIEYVNNIKTRNTDYNDFIMASTGVRGQILDNIYNPDTGEAVDIDALVRNEYIRS